MTYSTTHCCQQMQANLASQELHLSYISKFREYGIDYADGGSSHQTIQFCPWCGSKLPASLRTQWFEELDAIGVDVDGEIPQIYSDSEWWIKKSL